MSQAQKRFNTSQIFTPGLSRKYGTMPPKKAGRQSLGKSPATKSPATKSPASKSLKKGTAIAKGKRVSNIERKLPGVFNWIFKGVGVRIRRSGVVLEGVGFGEAIRVDLQSERVLIRTICSRRSCS
jgi:hypothetical protein